VTGRMPGMMRKAYQADLSDTEWACIEMDLSTPKASGPPKVHTTREILDAVFYIVRSGCAWRLLLCDFPPWKTFHARATSGCLRPALLYVAMSRLMVRRLARS
jgi:transposase